MTLEKLIANDWAWIPNQLINNRNEIFKGTSNIYFSGFLDGCETNIITKYPERMLASERECHSK